ncbi:MAG: hypothetical protein ACTSYI_11825 [Promethearchaeota archaeon]
MVDIKDGVDLAFSIILSNKIILTEENIIMDARMIPGLGKTKAKEIRKAGNFQSIGMFLSQDPEALAQKVKGKSAKKIKEHQIQFREAFQYRSHNPDQSIR